MEDQGVLNCIEKQAVNMTHTPSQYILTVNYKKNEQEKS